MEPRAGLVISVPAVKSRLHRNVLNQGVNFIRKPFSIEGLALKVREVLDAR